MDDWLDGWLDGFLKWMHVCRRVLCHTGIGVDYPLRDGVCAPQHHVKAPQPSLSGDWVGIVVCARC